MSDIQNKKPFVNIHAIATYPSYDKIEKIARVFANFKWDFKVEQKNNAIIFALFFGNLNLTNKQIEEQGEYSLISFTENTFECACTLCDLKYETNTKKTACVHLVQNIISIRKYIDAILINPASHIKAIFDVGLVKKKKYLAKAMLDLFLDISNGELIDFTYISKSRDHLLDIIEMIAKNKVNLNSLLDAKKITYFYNFLHSHKLKIVDFQNEKRILELIANHYHEIINFISIIYYDQKGNKKIIEQIESVNDLKLKIEVAFDGSAIVARQQYWVYDYTNVFDKNQVYILVVDNQNENKLLIVQENINDVFHVLNFEEMSYRTLKAFLHNFETIKDSIDSKRIVNSLNMPNLDNLDRSGWKFTVIIDDLILEDELNNERIIAVSIFLNIGENKHNIIAHDIKPWFKYIDEALLDKLLEIKNLGYVYQNEKVAFNLSDQQGLIILEDHILAINKSKKVEVLINSNYISGGKKTKFNFKPRIINESLIVEVFHEEYMANEIEEILQAYRQKMNLTKLGTGKIINFANIDFQALEKQMNYFNQDIDVIENNQFEIASSNIFFAASLPNNSNEIIDFVNQFNNFIAKPNLPENLRNYLKPYQVDGYLWMKKLLEFSFGCLLADDMGVGKTVQTIAIIADLLSINPKSKVLIVCPVTLMYNWEREINHHLNHVKVVQVEGRKESRETILAYTRAAVFITSYTLFSKDIEYYQRMKVNLMIIDEAQVIKNSDTQISKSIREINANSKIALSGTPIENNLSELWSIMDFLNPKILGDKKDFYTNYEKDIYAGNVQKQEALKKIVKPFLLRRTKNEVLKDLPSKIEKVYSIDFNFEEEEIYNSFLEYIRLELKLQDNNKNKTAFLFKTILKLRQICCDARLIGESIKKSSKLEYLIENIQRLIQEDATNKIIVFSQFTSMLDLIQEELEAKGIGFHILTGKTHKDDRGKMVDQFNSDETNVFLISLKAGGAGLNITSANHVFHYDPWWNIAAEMQATDRAHRLGQKRSVMVYKLIMKNSLEERILTLQYKKHALFKVFVEAQDDNKIDLKTMLELIGV